MLRAVLALLFLAGPAFSDDGCHDLWFARNATIDRFGYCFGSPLGKAVFDSTACLGKEVALDAEAEALVRTIRERETAYGCKVDTSQTVLKVDDLAIRWRLLNQPIRDRFESACLGWLGPVVPLRAGHNLSAPVIGQIVPGANISLSYELVGDWTYVTTTDESWTTLSGGWLLTTSMEMTCRDFAG